MHQSYFIILFTVVVYLVDVPYFAFICSFSALLWPFLYSFAVYILVRYRERIQVPKFWSFSHVLLNIHSVMSLYEIPPWVLLFEQCNDILSSIYQT